MWGAGAVKAPDKCYESNTEGDQFGTSKNIYIKKFYIQCSDSHVH